MGLLRNLKLAADFTQKTCIRYTDECVISGRFFKKRGKKKKEVILKQLLPAGVGVG